MYSLDNDNTNGINTVDQKLKLNNARHGNTYRNNNQDKGKIILKLTKSEKKL